MKSKGILKGLATVVFSAAVAALLPMAPVIPVMAETADACQHENLAFDYAAAQIDYDNNTFTGQMFCRDCHGYTQAISGTVEIDEDNVDFEYEYSEGTYAITISTDDLGGNHEHIYYCDNNTIKIDDEGNLNMLLYCFDCAWNETVSIPEGEYTVTDQKANCSGGASTAYATEDPITFSDGSEMGYSFYVSVPIDEKTDPDNHAGVTVREGTIKETDDTTATAEVYCDSCKKELGTLEGTLSDVGEGYKVYTFQTDLVEEGEFNYTYYCDANSIYHVFQEEKSTDDALAYKIYPYEDEEYTIVMVPKSKLSCETYEGTCSSYPRVHYYGYAKVTDTGYIYVNETIYDETGEYNANNHESNWIVDDTIQWADDYSSATFDINCPYCGETIASDITSTAVEEGESEEATCVNPAYTMYRVSYNYNGEEFTDSVRVTDSSNKLNPDNHVYVTIDIYNFTKSGDDQTLTTAEYCKRCGTIINSELVGTLITDEYGDMFYVFTMSDGSRRKICYDDFENVHGHDMTCDSKQTVLNKDGSLSVVARCEDCTYSEKITVPASILSVTEHAATCTEGGYRYYSGSCETAYGDRINVSYIEDIANGETDPDNHSYLRIKSGSIKEIVNANGSVSATGEAYCIDCKKDLGTVSGYIDEVEKDYIQYVFDVNGKACFAKVESDDAYDVDYEYNTAKITATDSEITFPICSKSSGEKVADFTIAKSDCEATTSKATCSSLGSTLYNRWVKLDNGGYVKLRYEEFDAASGFDPDNHSDVAVKDGTLKLGADKNTATAELVCDSCGKSLGTYTGIVDSKTWKRPNCTTPAGYYYKVTFDTGSNEVWTRVFVKEEDDLADFNHSDVTVEDGTATVSDDGESLTATLYCAACNQSLGTYTGSIRYNEYSGATCKSGAQTTYTVYFGELDSSIEATIESGDPDPSAHVFTEASYDSDNSANITYDSEKDEFTVAEQCYLCGAKDDAHTYTSYSYQLNSIKQTADGSVQFIYIIRYQNADRSYRNICYYYSDKPLGDTGIEGGADACDSLTCQHANIVVDKAVAATCVKNGLTEGKHCADCGKVFVAQTDVPATGRHTWSAYKVSKAATALAAGSKYRTCTVCKKKETKAITKLTPTIGLSATKKTLKVKKSYTLKITKLAKGDSVSSVKSNKTKVAVVKKSATNKYKITAKKKGKATITIKLKSGKTAKCVITVK